MNPELYESLSRQAAHMLTRDQLTPYNYDIYMKHLVGLVVQECVQLAVDEEERFYNMDQDELALAMENFQALLKQHFGVEL